MTIHVNGRPRELAVATTVGSLVDGEVADRRGVAVAVDGQLLPRSAWDQEQVIDGMRLEIVGAVQGG